MASWVRLVQYCNPSTIFISLSNAFKRVSFCKSEAVIFPDGLLIASLIADSRFLSGKYTTDEGIVVVVVEVVVGRVVVVVSLVVVVVALVLVVVLLVVVVVTLVVVVVGLVVVVVTGPVPVIVKFIIPNPRS